MTSTPARISWLAVFAGFFTDYFISLLISLGGRAFDPQHVPGSMPTSTASMITVVALTLSTGFGGWLAGRLAKHEHVLHGVLVGGVGLIALLLDSLFVMPASLFTIVHALVLVVAGGVGGLVSRWLPAPRQS